MTDLVLPPKPRLSEADRQILLRRMDRSAQSHPDRDSRTARLAVLSSQRAELEGKAEQLSMAYARVARELTTLASKLPSLEQSLTRSRADLVLGLDTASEGEVASLLALQVASSAKAAELHATGAELSSRHESVAAELRQVEYELSALEGLDLREDATARIDRELDSMAEAYTDSVVAIEDCLSAFESSVSELEASRQHFDPRRRYGLDRLADLSLALLSTLRAAIKAAEPLERIRSAELAALVLAPVRIYSDRFQAAIAAARSTHHTPQGDSTEPVPAESEPQEPEPAPESDPAAPKSWGGFRPGAGRKPKCKTVESEARP